MTSDPVAPIALATEAKRLPGLSTRRANLLGKLGVRTAQDLLFLFPRDYELPAPAMRVDELKDGEEAALVGEITECELVSRSAGKSAFGAIVENESGIVRIMFFNQPFRASSLRTGTRVMFSGMPRLNGLRWEFVHPKVTILGADEALPTPRPLPIYPLTDGLKQVDLRRVTASITPLLAADLKEVMPDSILERAAEHLRADGF